MYFMITHVYVDIVFNGIINILIISYKSYVKFI